MPYKKRSSDTKKSLIGVAKGMGAGALIVLALVAIGLLVQSFLNRQKPEAPIRVAMEKSEEPADASSEIRGKYYGLCKKNSIRSVEDFRTTVQKDPVLAVHFADFNWETARLGKQENALWTYVSYRKGETIKRTSKPVRLPKGDGYVTDGNRVVRTFCCNDYIEAPPPREMSMAEPPKTTERVDAPPRRAAPPQKVAALPPVEDSPSVIAESFEKSPAVPGVPTSFTSPPGSPTFRNNTSHHPPPSPPTVVPEPATILLVGVGGAVLGFFRLFRRKNT